MEPEKASHHPEAQTNIESETPSLAKETDGSDEQVEHSRNSNGAQNNLNLEKNATAGALSEAPSYEAKSGFHRIMALVAMAFLWTASQIPLYLLGGIPPYIYRDIGGTDRWIWFVLANLLALAATAPFVGALSDLLGRRYVAIAGASLIVIGMIVCSTAHVMNIFIAGMAIAGAGAGINELTALAVASELAPTSQRGKYVAVLVFSIIPFCPSVLWAQLIASHSTWRYVGLFCALWAFTGLVMTVIFYFPPPRSNSTGMSRREIIKQIDFIGGFLSISGMILFLAGLLWGGYMYKWKSAHVLVPLLLGAALLIGFVFWEAYGAPYPMFPSRLKKDPRILLLTLIITFISGANFFSVLLFWPTQAYNVYGHDPVGVGLRAMPIGFCILGGAFIVLWLLSIFRGGNRILMFVSSSFMAAGCGALAAARIDNIHAVYAMLVIGGLGIGGIVVPASIMTTIICPDDLIATVTALTLSIRVIGGAVGYTTYYNIFQNKFVENITKYMLEACVANGIDNVTTIVEAAQLTADALVENILTLPGVDGNVTKYEALVYAGQLSYANAYPYVYYASIAFGCVAVIASLFLGDISKYMDDHVAVVMH